MASADSKKNQEMAAHLKAQGIWHGRRMTKGLSNIPKMGEVGSAAYRRLQTRKRGANA